MTSLYIHIPFCKRKCLYCDFVSYAGKEELIDSYVDALIKEVHNSDFGFRLPAGQAGISDFSTIYFGGGTPTLLSPEHFNKIMSSIICHLSLVISHLEVSVESNPGTADLAKLKALRQLGINRLSIGAQSFNDKHLQTLGRIHSAKEIFRIYEDARTAGFDNINLDLMFALPAQTLKEWQNDLQTALKLKPEHLSTYNLQLEENTPLFELLNPNCKLQTSKQIPKPKSQLPTNETELEMYEYTIETLTANGYRHYEISNFARPGFECRHNINYWQNGDYVGLGAGAHSHLNGRRWSNPNCLEVYLTRPQTHDISPDSTSQGETLFLGLRLIEGLAKEPFRGFEKEVDELTKDGLLTEAAGKYKLSRKGLYLGNLVFEKFV